MSKLIKIYKSIKYILFLVFGSVLKLHPKYRDIWLIAERGYDARDNAYHLFNYIMTLNERPNIYYIIDKNSEDFNKLTNYKNVIQHGSFKHWLFFSISSKKISTHIMGTSPDINVFSVLGKLNIIYGEIIFLQHGIIYNDFPALYYPKVKLDLFVCGAKPEFDYVCEGFGHPIGVVKYLGLCRYDNLIEFETERIILIMPTWRSFLSSYRNDTEFLKTDYFNRYNNLINSTDLTEILEEYDYKVVFYPHYEVQKFVDCFNNENERVIIASKNDYDVQHLLKSAQILITDFSSVFFDFAYMKKPVIFYHFDSDDSYRKPGYMDLRNCLFGESYNKEKDLINSVKDIVVRGGTLLEKNEQSINNFFLLRDSNNCKRTYEAIKEVASK